MSVEKLAKKKLPQSVSNLRLVFSQFFKTLLMIQLNNRFNFINFVIWLQLRGIQFTKSHLILCLDIILH